MLRPNEEDEHPPGAALLAAIEGQLEPVEGAEVLRHIESCAECSTRIKEFTDASALYNEYHARKVVPPVRPEPGAWLGFYNRLDEEASRGRFPGLAQIQFHLRRLGKASSARSVWFALAASVLVVCGIILFPHRDLPVL